MVTLLTSYVEDKPIKSFQWVVVNTLGDDGSNFSLFLFKEYKLTEYSTSSIAEVCYSIEGQLYIL